ncbi:metallophosphoesterase [uncultured Mucilaginibacter sp.]|uniref:metallophosphoesterase n=1 Tax=uncultured Mucilaginibacter sp. TaxID=797541 RepID=UPI0025F3ACF1|nr:metallophosphoesterase [uncultured Mucilaginibacter sp.]
MMEGVTLNLLFFIAIVLLLDVYVFRGLSKLSVKWKFIGKRWFFITWVTVTTVLLGSLLLAVYVKIDLGLRLVIVLAFFGLLLFKACFALVLLVDDLRRLSIFIGRKRKKTSIETVETKQPPTPIPRSEFLLKAGLLAGAVPLAAFKLNMKSGLYDYQVKRHNLYLPNLPKAFDGMKLGQISDIHSGSFFDKKAVLGGVEMLLGEKPDLIFFTGDLVNEQTNEMRDYQDIFSKVKAPLGVFSSLGNHDYGDYADWASPAAKQKNLDDLVQTHKNMGWDLLRNENRRLKIGNEEIGILGIENWGELSRFPKYGRMDLAVKNTDDLPVKLLLSHDPSHWRAQVLPHYPQIDMVFAGHTHGMQFGLRTELFQWSPVEYLYNEWAGFYRESKQQIYVNVGYGFFGFRGRVGILPEITIFTLKAGPDPLQSLS